MTGDSETPSRKLLVYEPRVEGHHPGWLRFITEDLLSADYELTLQVDLRTASRPILEEHLRDLMGRVRMIPAIENNGRRRGGNTARSIALGLEASGAPRAFLCAFDELASAAFRRAALGINPPPALRGRMGGIYHRPRFAIAPRFSPNRWLKLRGLRRLLTTGWIHSLLFVDEYLAADLQRAYPGAPIHFLPDPCPEGYQSERTTARAALGLPEGRHICLFFGVGSRRKGLHVAVEAFLALNSSASLLLVAGRQNPAPDVRGGLDQLVRQGRALVMDRYVSSDEEKLCFQAADVVLLPYVGHFGTSGVLSRAMAAGKPVIVSDEQLLGQLTRHHDIGLLFPPGDAAALAGCIKRSASLSAPDRQRFVANAQGYAAKYSRAAYRKALLASLEPR
jgi:glycosyltransferase involved in cell wall biosynthesis